MSHWFSLIFSEFNPWYWEPIDKSFRCSTVCFAYRYTAITRDGAITKVAGGPSPIIRDHTKLSGLNENLLPQPNFQSARFRFTDAVLGAICDTMETKEFKEMKQGWFFKTTKIIVFPLCIGCYIIASTEI